jgi:hypothetical protein
MSLASVGFFSFLTYYSCLKLILILVINTTSMSSHLTSLVNFFTTQQQGTTLIVEFFEPIRSIGERRLHCIFNQFQYNHDLMWESKVDLSGLGLFYIHQIKFVQCCITFKDISSEYYSPGDLFNISYRLGSYEGPRLVKIIKEENLKFKGPSILVLLMDHPNVRQYRWLSFKGITSVQYVPPMDTHSFAHENYNSEQSDYESSSFESGSETDTDEDMAVLSISELESLKSSASRSSTYIKEEVSRRTYDYRFALEEIKEEKNILGKDNLILLESEKNLTQECTDKDATIHRLRTKTSYLMGDLRSLQSKYDTLVRTHNEHLQFQYEVGEDVQLEFTILKQDATRLQKENDHLKHELSIQTQPVQNTYQIMNTKAKIITSTIKGYIIRQKLKQYAQAARTIQAVLWSTRIRKDTYWALEHLNENHEIEIEPGFSDASLSGWEVLN